MGEATGDRPIVEDSRKDDYWGAKTVADETLEGKNVLGRLLMELRGKLISAPDTLKVVEPLPLNDFLLLERPIETIFANKGNRAPTPVVKPASTEDFWHRASAGTGAER